MAGRIPENILEDILGRVDIVEVIQASIPLKRAGRNFKANCPFHHEKTPSFMVSSERQIYHCFGCGESGNAFKFLMRHERMEFREAVEMLAKKSGVVLPETQNQLPQASGLTTQLYKVLELAASFYGNNLNSQEGLRAKEYLLKRGITTETIKSFGLGLAWEKWDSLIASLRQKQIALALLEKAGLIVTKDGGGYYDRFRNRIIFPILDIKSRPLAFGARVLDSTLPKYINSPETPIYTKGRNLYGLNFSKDAIREADSCVVVEGYLDFIIPFQAGLKNIVALSGTALTVEQARLLKRYTHNAVMVYDADSAGEIATLRSLDIFIEEEMNVRVVSLPKGFDPDLFVRENGIGSFKEKISQAKNLFDYKLGVLKLRFNPSDAEDKAKIALSMLETIHKVKNAVLKSEYLKMLSQNLDIREEALMEELNKIKGDKLYAKSIETGGGKDPGMNPTEKLLIKLMLEEEGFIKRIKESLEPADFHDQRASRIVSIMFDLVSQGKKLEPKLLINYLDDEDISQVVCQSIFLPDQASATEQQKEKMLDDCIRRLKSKKLKLKRGDLEEKIKAAQSYGDDEKINKLLEEFESLIKRGQ